MFTHHLSHTLPFIALKSQDTHIILITISSSLSSLRWGIESSCWAVVACGRNWSLCPPAVPFPCQSRWALRKVLLCPLTTSPPTWCCLRWPTWGRGRAFSSTWQQVRHAQWVLKTSYSVVLRRSPNNRWSLKCWSATNNELLFFSWIDHLKIWHYNNKDAQFLQVLTKLNKIQTVLFKVRLG